ncbi:hypothetical protein C8Q69DRAFT_386507, partial [Paecilomyces variotii]
DGPYVHPHVLSFPDGKMKTSWCNSLPDIDVRDTYSFFWKAPKGGKQIWFAVCSTPSKNWV